MFTRREILVLMSLTVDAFIAPAAVSAEFSPRFLVSGPNACNAEVAIDANGDAVFTWDRFIPDLDESRIEARRRSADGVFGPIQVVSGRGRIESPRLAIDAAGNAIIAWTLASIACGFLGPEHAQFRTFSAAGVLGPIENLTTVLPAESARVANARGDSIFAWRRKPKGSSALRSRRERSHAQERMPRQ